MENMIFVITVTGTKKAGGKLGRKYKNDAKVVDAASLLEIHKQREGYALAADLVRIIKNGWEGADAQSRELWQQYNWGIHPASLKDDGFAFTIRTIGPSVEGIRRTQALSKAYPDLYFDAVFCDLDKNTAGIILMHKGQLRLFSPIVDDGFAAFHASYARIGEALCDEPDDIIAKYSPEELTEIYFVNALLDRKQICR